MTKVPQNNKDSKSNINNHEYRRKTEIARPSSLVKYKGKENFQSEPINLLAIGDGKEILNYSTQQVAVADNSGEAIY